jgi:hypothetical protein
MTKEPIITAEEWEDWEEWLANPQTKAFLSSLGRHSAHLKRQYLDLLWSQPVQAPSPHHRARSLAYSDLAEIADSPEAARKILETLMERET